MIIEINARNAEPEQVRTELGKYGISLPDDHDFSQFVKYKVDIESRKIIEVEKLFTSVAEFSEAEKEAYVRARFENIDEDDLMDGEEFRRELDALDDELRSS